jgi:hypothetical protein
MEVQPSLKEQNEYCLYNDKTRGRTKRHHIKKDYKGKDVSRDKRCISPPPKKRPGNHMITLCPWDNHGESAVRRLLYKKQTTEISVNKPTIEEVLDEENTIQNDVKEEVQLDITIE